MGKSLLLATCAGFSLILSGCGGSSGGSGPGLAPPAPPPPPPPPSEPSIGLQQVYPNLTFVQPVSLQQAPDDGTTWYAVEQAGRILAFANDQAASGTVTFLDISDRVASGGEQGLLGLAFDPDFPVVEDVYVSYTASNSSDELFSILSRFALLPDGSALNPASEQLILVVPQDFGNHNGGTQSLQRLRTTFADVTITEYDGLFSGDHDIGSAFDSVYQ